MATYLGKCINEALRAHPAVNLPLERVTPTMFQLPNGQCLLARTIVCLCAWTVQHDPATLGNRVDEYVPERWMQGSSENEETFRSPVDRVKRADLAFGHRTRTGLSKSIAVMQIYKTVPTLLKIFDIELVDSRTAWGLKNAWFVHQAEFKLLLKKRSKSISL